MIEKITVSLLLAFFVCSLPCIASADVKEDASLDDLLEDITVDDQVLKAAMAERLRVERQQVAVEISNDVFYEKDDIVKARAILQKGKNTRADNIECIMRAFAIVDSDFAVLCEKMAGNKTAQVIEGLEKIINSKEANYFSAAKHYLYAEALAISAKDYWDAIDAYGNIIVNMPDKISYAASASVRSGELFESQGRLYYATDLYAYAIRNYALTLNKTEKAALEAKVEKNRKIYADPLDAAGSGMKSVEERLASIDSGKVTQLKEDEIVIIITDMIKMLEEAQENDPKDKPKSNPSSKTKSGDGSKDGKKNPGSSSQSTVRDKKTDDPATTSTPPKIFVDRIEEKTVTYEGLEESGGWSELPPREKQQMRELLQMQLSERNREAIRLYFIERARIVNK